MIAVQGKEVKSFSGSAPRATDLWDYLVSEVSRILDTEVTLDRSLLSLGSHRSWFPGGLQPRGGGRGTSPVCSSLTNRWPCIGSCPAISAIFCNPTSILETVSAEFRL